jgi:hypothetical protein
LCEETKTQIEFSMGLKLGQRFRLLEKTKNSRAGPRGWKTSVVGACGGFLSYSNLLLVAGSAIFILCSLVFFDIRSYSSYLVTYSATTGLLHPSLDQYWNLTSSSAGQLQASTQGAAHILNGDAARSKNNLRRECNLTTGTATAESSHEYDHGTNSISGTSTENLSELQARLHQHPLDFDSSQGHVTCREEDETSDSEEEKEVAAGQTGSLQQAHQDSDEGVQRHQDQLEHELNDSTSSRIDEFPSKAADDTTATHESEASSESTTLASSQAQDHDQSVSENSTSAAIQGLKTAELLEVSASRSTDAEAMKESVLGSDLKNENPQAGVDTEVILLPTSTDHTSIADHSTEVDPSDVSAESAGTQEEEKAAEYAAGSTAATRPRFSAACDIFHGSWVYDESYPLYRAPNCPFMDPGFRCEQNGRPNLEYMKYRWQPHDCNLPRCSIKTPSYNTSQNFLVNFKRKLLAYNVQIAQTLSSYQ